MFGKDDKFCLANVIEVNPKWSHFTFIDVAGRGKTDAVILDDDSKLHVFLNMQKDSTGKQESSELCVSKDISGDIFQGFDNITKNTEVRIFYRLNTYYRLTTS